MARRGDRRRRGGHARGRRALRASRRDAHEPHRPVHDRIVRRQRWTAAASESCSPIPISTTTLHFQPTDDGSCSRPSARATVKPTSTACIPMERGSSGSPMTRARRPSGVVAGRPSAGVCLDAQRRSQDEYLGPRARDEEDAQRHGRQRRAGRQWQAGWILPPIVVARRPVDRLFIRSPHGMDRSRRTAQALAIGRRSASTSSTRMAAASRV